MASSALRPAYVIEASEESIESVTKIPKEIEYEHEQGRTRGDRVKSQL
jgi:hypothetical protein